VTWDPVRSDYLITTSRDKTIKIWDIRTEKATTVPTDFVTMYTACSPDGNTLAMGNPENVITFLDLRKLKIEGTIPIQPDDAYEISWNPTGDLLFVATGEGTINVYEYPSLKQAYVINAHTGTCFCIKFDPKKRQDRIGSLVFLLLSLFSHPKPARSLCFQILCHWKRGYLGGVVGYQRADLPPHLQQALLASEDNWLQL